MNYKLNRRELLQTTFRCSLLTLAYASIRNPYPAFGDNQLAEVQFYNKLPDAIIECGICPKKCKVSPNARGICGNKENRDGTFYSLVHSQPCALNLADPIEKKPFFHFIPGIKTLSLATAGCNFTCRFCQNWDISQSKPEEVKTVSKTTPENIIELAKANDIKAVAFTYGEPVVFYEYMYDVAVLCRKNGIKAVMVSNGYINEAPLRKLCPQLDAIKIDLKSFSDDFYQKYCGGTLKPVLDTLVTLKKIGIWLEIVVLIIPTLNDSEAEIQKMCEWIKSNLGPDVPLHFTRFHPAYKLTNLTRTPQKTLEQAYEIARKAGLNYAYIGNSSPHKAESTYCPKCKNILIERQGYIISQNLIKDGKCPACQHSIPGVWKQ